MLMQAHQGLLPPPGGYRLRTGREIALVLRFFFDAPGEYRVNLRLVLSEGDREWRAELVHDLGLTQVADLDGLPSDCVRLTGSHKLQLSRDDFLRELKRDLAPGRERV